MGGNWQTRGSGPGRPRALEKYCSGLEGCPLPVPGPQYHTAAHLPQRRNRTLLPSTGPTHTLTHAKHLRGPQDPLPVIQGPLQTVLHPPEVSISKRNRDMKESSQKTRGRPLRPQTRMTDPSARVVGREVCDTVRSETQGPSHSVMRGRQVSAVNGPPPRART